MASVSCIAVDGLTLLTSSEHWLRFSVQGSNATSFEPRLCSMTIAFMVNSVSFSALAALAFGGLQVCSLLRPQSPATSSMSFPDPPLMVLHGHEHAQSHFQLFWGVQSNFHLLLMCWQHLWLYSAMGLSVSWFSLSTPPPFPSPDDSRQHLLFVAVSRGAAEHHCSNQDAFIGFLLYIRC